jgi:putative transposase
MAQSPLNALSEAELALAFERFELLRPALEGGVPLARVARDQGIALRTAQHWARQYRRDGLAGLVRKGRSDRGKRHLSHTLRQAIEGLALKKPRLSAAVIHRQAVILAERLGKPPPTYRIVHAVIRDLEPALLTLAHEGTKAYSEAFDLIHRHEATGPNAVWAEKVEAEKVSGNVCRDGRWGASQNLTPFPPPRTWFGGGALSRRGRAWL